METLITQTQEINSYSYVHNSRYHPVYNVAAHMHAHSHVHEQGRYTSKMQSMFFN